jgi:uncharacterized membrane protein YozB (DUF420 family)
MVSFVGSTVSLVIQVVVLALIIGALIIKRQNKYRQHGIVMLSAVILHIISIFAVMVPSFAEFYAMPSLIDYADVFVILTLVHVVSGVISAVLGVWIVGSWHLQKDIKPCFRKKRIMDVTVTLWLLALLLGIVLYLKIIGTI